MPAPYTITEVEDAMLAVLAPAAQKLGVREVKTYGGELEEDDLAKLAGRFPAIYAAYGGSIWSQHGSRKKERLLFSLFCCDRNLRSEAEVRRGGARNPGGYALLQVCRDNLIGARFGLGDGVEQMIIQAERLVLSQKTITIFEAQYEITQSHLYDGD